MHRDNIKQTTLFNNLSPPHHPGAILEYPPTKTMYAVLCQLRHAATYTEHHTLFTYAIHSKMARVRDELLNKVVFFFFFAQK